MERAGKKTHEGRKTKCEAAAVVKPVSDESLNELLSLCRKQEVLHFYKTDVMCPANRTLYKIIYFESSFKLIFDLRLILNELRVLRAVLSI